jgi:hypothetical protein
MSKRQKPGEDMKPKTVTVEKEVLDQRTKEIHWAVTATFTEGERGDPVCIEYRVRVVRGSTTQERLVNLHLTLDGMGRQADDELAGEGPFPNVGIPRYVFEQASQGRLLEKARASLARGGRSTSRLSAEAQALITPPAHKPGRPPQRSMAEKLRILAAVEASYESGATLEDVGKQFNMSRSAVRDLLGWARNDAQPRLFEGRGKGRRGGQMTKEARAMQRKINKEG